MKSISKEKSEIINLLKKYDNTKLFYKEQLEFKKEFIRITFDPEGYVNYNARTILFFNAMLQDMNIPYLISDRFIPNKKEDNVFWIIFSVES